MSILLRDPDILLIRVVRYRGDVGGMLSGVMKLGKQIVNQNSGGAEKTKQ